MSKEKAHNLAEKRRTDDVIIQDDITFKDLLLSDSTLMGLEDSGFRKPSPIQRKAIPLGRCGFDLIVQAKSGTGKTCVFTVIALEMLQTELKKLQVLILTPTREIAVQIKDVISALGRYLTNFKVESFIGGTPLENDKKNILKCQIAVGAPGRVKHLISEGLMKVDAIRLFVLDEADKLMEDNFRRDISFIYLKLPEMKQMIAASATFPPLLEEFVKRYMTNPTRVSPGKDVFLLGIRQFVSVIPAHLSVLVQIKNKVTDLLRILSTVPFNQCLVFSNYQSRAESICNELNKEGWHSLYISGSQNQTDRLKAMSSLKQFRCRVLLSTDLTSRGIDAENVDVIVNLDLPRDAPTYMHRIGRAGRYGTRGLAITILQGGTEVEQFRKMLTEIVGGGGFHVYVFPEKKFSFNIWEAEDDAFEKLSSVAENELLGLEAEAKKKKKKMYEKSLGELFAYHLNLPQKSEMDDYDDLVALAEGFTKQDPKEVSDTEEGLNYEDYPSHLIATVLRLERGDRKNQRIENCQRPEKESDEQKREKKAEEGEDEDEDDDDDDDDEEQESDDAGECEWEDYGEELPVESLALRRWYSAWYAQSSIITYYVTYFRNLSLWNDEIGHR